jgi:hypothetical protein
MKWVYVIAIIAAFFYLGQVIESIVTGNSEQKVHSIKLGAQP